MDAPQLFFAENPFPAAPSADRFLSLGSTETARQRLAAAITEQECPAMLVGPPGTGKTLVCETLADQFESTHDVVFLAETRLCTRKALLQHLLHHLGLPFAGCSEGELRLALIDRVTINAAGEKQGLLLLVDEAQGLPGRLLEELRMISGIVRGGQAKVQLVLAGRPTLDERLAHPRMEPLSQRVGTRCYLHPLSQAETCDYIRQSLKRVGAPDTAIDGQAMQSVYFASDGIPRLINQTMSRAVALAQAAGAVRIDGDLVEQAWAELQQLPSPMQDLPTSFGQASGESDADFGAAGLDPVGQFEDSDDGPATIEFVYGGDECSNSRCEDHGDSAPADGVDEEVVGHTSEKEAWKEPPALSTATVSQAAPAMSDAWEHEEFGPITIQLSSQFGNELNDDDLTGDEFVGDDAMAETVDYEPGQVSLDPPHGGGGQEPSATAAPEQQWERTDLFGDGFDEEVSVPGAPATEDLTASVIGLGGGASVAETAAGEKTPIAEAGIRAFDALQPIDYFGPTSEIEEVDWDQEAPLGAGAFCGVSDPEWLADDVAVHEAIVEINRSASEGIGDMTEVLGTEMMGTDVLGTELSSAADGLNQADFEPQIIETPAADLVVGDGVITPEAISEAAGNVFPVSAASEETADWEGKVVAEIERSAEIDQSAETDESREFVGERAGNDITVRGDADLLIIEDDITVEEPPQALAPRGLRQRTASSLDARGILSRMREG